MSKKSLEYGAIISNAWNILTKNVWKLIGIYLVTLIVSELPSIINSTHNAWSNDALLYGIMTFVYIGATVLTIVVSLGAIRVALKAEAGEQYRATDLFQNKAVWRYFGAGILYFLIVLGGLILFIVPGIIWAIKYWLFPYYLLDDDCGVVESLKRSGQATKGYKFQLLILGILSMFIELAGVLALGVGIFFTTPLVALIGAGTYRFIKSQSSIAAPATPPSTPSTPTATKQPA